MRTASAGLTAHLALETTTLATCWKVTRTDATVLTVTDHDSDIVFDGDTYAAASGFTATDIATNSEMSVDNLDVVGALSSPAITDEDLLAGLWDHATVEIFLVNYADLTQGALIQRVGWLGEVTVDRGTFKAELRGLMQALQTTVGEMGSASCRADLGDARCTVDLGPFTVTGTIDSVSSDGLTLYDAARTEPGPTGGLAITDVSNADPGVVTLAAVTGLTDGAAISISGVVGPTAINTTTIVYDLDTDALTFSLGIDTSDTAIYPPYVSGGTVTPLGGDSGYFDGGVITFTTGLNTGRSVEVKSYVPGQWTLHIPFPYAISAGDEYSMVAGCDKSFSTCRDRFNNVANFRGEPYRPGIDKLVQVGRS